MKIQEKRETTFHRGLALILVFLLAAGWHTAGVASPGVKQ